MMATPHETDFHGWTQGQAAKLRALATDMRRPIVQVPVVQGLLTTPALFPMVSNR